ncbi:MAG: SpoVG family protein [Planctomycetota bacterium]
MKITDVRVKLAPGAAAAGAEPGRLLAFCSITLDACFVVRDLKLIRGEQGPFVAMPSRKITARCVECGGKNPLRASYCGECGAALNGTDELAAAGANGRPKLYADIAHPINAACRSLLERTVVAAWERECVLSQAPNYICRYDDCDFGEPAPARGAASGAPPSRRLPSAPGVVRRVDGGAPADMGRAAVRAPRTAVRTGRRTEKAGGFGDGL